jgi:hypothetical protein
LQTLETSAFACSNRGGKEVQSRIGGLEFLGWVPELLWKSHFHVRKGGFHHSGHDDVVLIIFQRIVERT